MKIKLILLLLSALFIFTDVSSACTYWEQDVPMCAHFTRADAVFMGKVTKIEHKFSGNEDGFWRRVHFKVQQNFKGADSPTFTLLTSPWEAACGLHVKKDQTWFVYAKFDDEDKVYRSFNGSKFDGKEDKDYLNFLKTASEGRLDTSISGQLIPAGSYTTNRYSGIEVTIEENGSQQTTLANDEGKFKFSSLKAGNYKVRLNFPYLAGVVWYYTETKYINQSGTPTLFGYEVKLKQGECDYKFMEVIKPTAK